MNWEGFGRDNLWNNRETLPEFACEDWGNPQISSFSIAEFQAHVRTHYLPSASQEPYSFTDLLSLRALLN
jgi:hypothetical protein